jgi:uncharacterized membrane protein (DUF373 family)
VQSDLGFFVAGERPLEHIDEIRKHYHFTAKDEETLKTLAEIFLPISDQFASEFTAYLLDDPNTAGYIATDAQVKRRKATIKKWFEEIFTSTYNTAYLTRIWRIGKVHVKIGLKGHYVNAAMNMVRNFCTRRIAMDVTDSQQRESLLETTNKVLDINLDILTSSYREEELKKVFLSHRVESLLIRSAERIMHGLNLILMVGLVFMAVGVVTLLGADIVYALTTNLENGVIKALGSLLILWMMIELLHTQVQNLRGGRFHVRVFVELALVAFIRKLFVASIEEKDPMTFGLLIGGLLVIGIIFLFTRTEEGFIRRGRR